MKKVLVIVDMQNDFVDGALGTPEAQAIVPKVADYIRTHADNDTVLVFTKDTHEVNYMDTLEGKNLPVAHCIRDTHGWEIHPEILSALYETREQYHPMSDCFNLMADHVVNKPTFGSINLQNLVYILDDDEMQNPGDVAEITLMGLCTGICVMSNAIMLKATLPEVPVRVVEECCACVTPDSHKTAIDAMRLCQIEII